MFISAFFTSAACRYVAVLVYPTLGVGYAVFSATRRTSLSTVFPSRFQGVVNFRASLPCVSPRLGREEGRYYYMAIEVVSGRLGTVAIVVSMGFFV